ncbi:MAG: hypothetical protein H7338_00925, partial [Candidatus Sericytochromatia bacterium]|nr:hypothetical protein [Candidatus Sericytochromatia bacterium]
SPTFAQDIEQGFFHKDIVSGRVHPGAVAKVGIGQSLMQSFLIHHSQRLPM